MISFSKWLAAAATTMMLAFGASAPAHAVVANKTFYFTGNCVDCAQAANGSGYTVTAELTLLGSYTLGQAITAGDFGNFVSFSYSGSNLVDPFTVLNDESVTTTGSMKNVPGMNDFDITYEDGLYFTTTAAGGFEVCGRGPADGYYNGSCSRYENDDFGNGSWSVTRGANDIPEPASLALVGLGLIGIVSLRRRQLNAA